MQNTKANTKTRAAIASGPVPKTLKEAKRLLVAFLEDRAATKRERARRLEVGIAAVSGINAEGYTDWRPYELAEQLADLEAAIMRGEYAKSRPISTRKLVDEAFTSNGVESETDWLEEGDDAPTLWPWLRETFCGLGDPSEVAS